MEDELEKEENELLHEFMRVEVKSIQEIKIDSYIMDMKEDARNNIKYDRKMEEMNNEHAKFKDEIKKIRQSNESVRLKFKMLATKMAYRLHLMGLASGHDIPDEELVRMIQSYKRTWPYEPLRIKTQEEQVEMQQIRLKSENKELSDLQIQMNKIKVKKLEQEKVKQLRL